MFALNTDIQICCSLAVNSLVLHSETGLLYHNKILSLIFQKLTTLFSMTATPFHVLCQGANVPIPHA